MASAKNGVYQMSEVGGEEAERLRKQAALSLALELPAFLETLPQSGSLVDLGCGVGVLADAVAAARPDAEVHGYDMDSSAVQKSLENFGHRPNLNFGCRLIQKGPPKTFKGADTATLRLVLMHNSDAEGLLRTVHAWVRPGATLHVLEADDRAMRFEPLEAWMSELLDLMQRVQTVKGGSRHLGQALPGLLTASGWRVVGQREISPAPELALAALSQVFLPVGDYYLKEAERLGLAPSESLARLRAGLEDLRQGRLPLERFHFPFFHVWARVP